jgi:4-amino-4-deoxy-L-arabinose transferase-like glycosyltransferase
LDARNAVGEQVSPERASTVGLRPRQGASREDRAASVGGQEHPDRGSFRVRLLVVALTGLVLRVTYVVLTRDDLVRGDGFAYLIYARNLAAGEGFVAPLRSVGVPDAIHPPLWALALTLPRLAGLTSQLDAQLFACLIGTATIVAVGYAGRQLVGPRVGVTAAAIVAIFPEFWMYEREVLSETLLLLVVAVTVLVVLAFIEQPSWARAVGVGAMCGVLALTRAEQILLVVLLLAPLILLQRTVAFRERVAWLGLAGVATAAVIAPWTAYNWSRFAHPVLLSTNLGPALVMGACDSVWSGQYIGYYDHECFERAVAATSRQEKRDASTVDPKLRSDAAAYVGDHLGRLPVVLLAREGRVWGIVAPLQTANLGADWSHTRRWVHQVGTVMFLALAVLAVYGVKTLRSRSRAIYPLLSFFVVVGITTALTYGLPRYRAAALVPLVLLSAVGIECLLERFLTRRTHAND